MPNVFSIAALRDGALATVTLIMAIIGLLTWVVGGVRRISAEQRANAVKQDRQEQLLKQAKAELTPNHGSSLRDAVNRIEALLGDQSAQIAELKERHKDLSVRFDHVVLTLLRGGSGE